MGPVGGRICPGISLRLRECREARSGLLSGWRIEALSSLSMSLVLRSVTTQQGHEQGRSSGILELELQLDHQAASRCTPRSEITGE